MFDAIFINEIQFTNYEKIPWNVFNKLNRFFLSLLLNFYTLQYTFVFNSC